MKALSGSWLSILTTMLLGVYSFIIGVALELGVESSMFSTKRYLNGKPLPFITEWFYGFHTDYTHTFLTLAFYPILILFAYLYVLVRSTPNAVERKVQFLLAAFLCFLVLTCYLLFGAFSLVLPFLPMWGGMLSDLPQRTPLLQQAVWIGLIVLVIINLWLAVRFLLSFRRRMTP